MPESKTDQPASYFLFHGPDLRLGELAPAITAERIALQPADSLLEQGFHCAGPSVLLVDQQFAGRGKEFAHLPEGTVVVAADAASERALGQAADLSLVSLKDASGRLAMLRAAFKLSAERLCYAHAQHALKSAREELTEFNRIGTALMVEHDKAGLLREIVVHAARFTVSDSAGIFILEENSSGAPMLCLRLLHSDSLADIAPDTTAAPRLCLDSTSIVGHVARTKIPFVVDDVRNLPDTAEYQHKFELIESFGYWVRSGVAVPLLNHRDETIGVLMLANRKADAETRIRSRADLDRYVIPYSPSDVERARALAGQAGVLIENHLLYSQIEHLFDSFVRACVTAIDQRDPTMAGHSIRVAALTSDFADAIERTTTGRYGPLRFSNVQRRELRYAALMHDLGKLSVHEDVIVKSKKLPPVLWERIQCRFELIRSALQLEFERKRAKLDPAARNSLPNPLEVELSERMAQLDRFQEAIQAANEPTPFPSDAAATMDDIAHHTFTRANGEIQDYLTADELHYLKIPRGSLDERERREIETHAAETFTILSKIDWADDLKGLVDYASGHHEKLDGTGYPRHLTADHIPVQTRLITIADIFDALTAADRPYKKAMPAEAALNLLESEAKGGLLDPELVRIMIESKVYERVRSTDWRTL